MTLNRLDAHFDQAGAWDIMGHVTGNLAFDVGANIGQSTRVLAPNFHRVVACEPCQESFDVLLVESAPNVVCHLDAVTAEPGEIKLTECAYSISTGQLTTGEGLGWGAEVGERTVPATTIDALTDHYGRPDFVKIDTEGHEVEILKGWRRRPPRVQVLIEVHSAANGPQVRQLWDGELFELRHASNVPRRIALEHYWLTNVDLPGVTT